MSAFIDWSVDVTRVPFCDHSKPWGSLRPASTCTLSLSSTSHIYSNGVLICLRLKSFCSFSFPSSFFHILLANHEWASFYNWIPWQPKILGLKRTHCSAPQTTDVNRWAEEVMFSSKAFMKQAVLFAVLALDRFSCKRSVRDILACYRIALLWIMTCGNEKGCFSSKILVKSFFSLTQGLYSATLLLKAFRRI